VVNFEQILFATGRMLDLTEGASGPAYVIDADRRTEMWVGLAATCGEGI
jgi:hypothetical protein